MATTDANGYFQIPNAPDETNIPIVIQVGKWRMQTTIPSVTKCQDNAVPDETLKFLSTVPAGDEINKAGSTPGTATMYFSFDTPTNAPLNDTGDPAYCRRAVYSDIYVGAASSDDMSGVVPTECATADLSAQEKALEFMLFDLSACVSPDNKPPPRPPPPPKPPVK